MTAEFEEPWERKMRELDEEVARRAGITVAELHAQRDREEAEQEQLEEVGKAAGAAWASRQTDLRVIRRVAEASWIRDTDVHCFWHLGIMVAGVDHDEVLAAMDANWRNDPSWRAVYAAQHAVLDNYAGPIEDLYDGPGSSWVEGFMTAVQAAWKEIQDRLVESAMNRMPTGSTAMKQ